MSRRAESVRRCVLSRRRAPSSAAPPRGASAQSVKAKGRTASVARARGEVSSVDAEKRSAVSGAWGDGSPTEKERRAITSRRAVLDQLPELLQTLTVRETTRVLPDRSPRRVRLPREQLHLHQTRPGVLGESAGGLHAQARAQGRLRLEEVTPLDEELRQGEGGEGAPRIVGGALQERAQGDDGRGGVALRALAIGGAEELRDLVAAERRGRGLRQRREGDLRRGLLVCGGG